ncbi:MAG: Crp/Fnr family transcriptional regulator [Pyrinomonadaceae bacterium]
MQTHSSSHPPIKNQLLSALSREEYARLFPHLELFRLTKGDVLYEAGDTVKSSYFILNGVVSLLSTTEDGGIIEVAMVGNEGMVGLPAILGIHRTPYRIMVQIQGNAMKIKADKLRGEFSRGGQLQEALLRYIHTLLTQISQSAVCNYFHTVEQRLCRWLLMCRDRVRSNEIHITQEFISHMLGIPRTNVTMRAGILQRKSLIRYKHGKITILDPRGLENTSCECYRVVKEEMNTFRANQPASDFFHSIV